MRYAVKTHKDDPFPAHYVRAAAPREHDARRNRTRIIRADLAQPASHQPRAPAHDGPEFSRLVGPRGWSRLDPEIRRRFGPGHAALPVTYEGVMTLDRSAAGVVFALLAGMFGGPLPLRCGAHIRSSVRVWSNGRGGIVWERRLRCPGYARTVSVRSIKRTDGAGGLLECVEGGLGMSLDVFEADGELVFQSRRYFVSVAGIRFPLPALLTPGRCRVAHRAAGPGRFEFSLEIIHPLWGQTFSQNGLFNDPELP